MIDRRRFVAAVVRGILCVPLATAAFAAEAQAPASATKRIGFLFPGSSTESPVGMGGVNAQVLTAVRQQLRADGWIEGENLVIDYRWAEGDYGRLPELAAELVRLKVDLIFAAAAPAALAAKRATSTIPVVFEMLGDPVSIGLVMSLARPGGNLTGVSGLAPELSGKRLELLRELMPGIRRIAVLTNPANVMTAPTVRETDQAARSLGIQLQVLDVREHSELNSAFGAIVRERSQALVVLQDPMLGDEWKAILAATNNSRLPAIFFESGWVRKGGLISYAPNLADSFRRAAIYADKILKGAKPGDLPVQQASKIELMINLKTAKALGLSIPQSLLLRADEVIQ